MTEHDDTPAAVRGGRAGRRLPPGLFRLRLHLTTADRLPAPDNRQGVRRA